MKSFPFLLFLAALGAGFFLTGKLLHQSGTPPDSSGKSAAATASSAVFPTGKKARTLADFLQMQTPGEEALTKIRITEALALLEPEEIAALARACTHEAAAGGGIAGQIWGRWAALDVQAAADWLPEIHLRDIRAAAAGAVIRRLAVEVPARAVEILRELPSEGRGAFIMLFFNRLAALDPQEAVRRFQELNLHNGTEPTYAVQSIAGHYTAQNPQAALAWAQSLPRERKEALTAVMEASVQAGPEKALALLHSAPLEQQRELTVSLAKTWSGKEPEAALAWAKTLTDAESRANAWLGVLQARPEKARDLLAEIPDIPEREAARYRLLAGDNRNAFVDEPTAAKLLQEAVPGVDVDRRTEKSITYRFRSDHPELLLDWAIGLRGDDVAEKAAAEALNTLAQRDQTADAVTRIAAVADPDRRRLLQRELAEQWNPENPAAAVAWLRTLPADEQREAEVRLSDHSIILKTSESSDPDDPSQ